MEEETVFVKELTRVITKNSILLCCLGFKNNLIISRQFNITYFPNQNMKGKMKGINHAANFFACFVMSHGSNIIAHLRINFTISRKNIVLIYLRAICYRGGLNNGLCVTFIDFLSIIKRIPKYLIKGKLFLARERRERERERYCFIAAFICTFLNVL